MSLDLTMTMRDVFHKLTTDNIVLDASYESQTDATFSDTDDFFVMLSNVCKRADDGTLIPFVDKSHPARISVNHVWNYKQIEIKLDNGTFTAVVSARYSWSIDDTLRSLEARYISAWLAHLERVGKRRYYENDHVYNFVDWLNGQLDSKVTVVVPPSPIWGKPSIQKLLENNTYAEVTGEYRDAHRFLTAVQETNTGVGVVFSFDDVPSTNTTFSVIRANAIITDGQNKVTQSVMWESSDKVEGLVNILSTFFAATPLKCYSQEEARYNVKDISSAEKLTTFLNTERPKTAKSDSSVIRTTYGSPTFEEDIRNWIIMQAEEMGVA